MRTLELSSIKIAENRQRQEFEPEALAELMTSIGKHGLLHPPVVRTEGDIVWLVAGERRLRAIADLWMTGGVLAHEGKIMAEGQVPVTMLSDLDPLDAEEAELEENIRRRDLTWQEHAAATARLHALRQKQNDKAWEEAPATGRGEATIPQKQTVADTAKEIHGRSDGDYQNSVRQEIILSRHLDNPAIAQAKTAKEAFKILKRQEEQEKYKEAAARTGETFSVRSHSVFNADSIEWMHSYSGEQFDVILTDPPYGMDAQDFGDAGGKMTGIQHHYDDSFESWEKLMNQWAPLTFKLTKPKAHAYIFCDIDNFHALKTVMQSAGWYVFRTPLTLYKSGSGRVPLPDRGPRRTTEWILYAIKGDKPTTAIYPDLLEAKGDENMGHGAQKPVAAFSNLLMRSVRPGDRVLDTFGGTGTLIPAAHGLQCIATVVERDAAAYGMCLKRLSDLAAQDSLGLDL